MEQTPSVFCGLKIPLLSSCFSFRDYSARLINFMLWIALIFVTFLLFRKLARLLRLWVKGNKIPGPPCPSFLAGHSKIVGGYGSARDLTGYLSELHEKYGAVVRVWLGPTQLLVSVKDVAVIKEMLIKAKDKLPLMGRACRLAFGRSNLFVSSFEKVQKGREYFEARVKERLLEKVNKVPLKVVDCVLGRIESIMLNSILDCRSISQHISFYILGTTLFEEAFLNWSDATLYEELLLLISRDACFWASYKIPPLWRREYWRYYYLCTKLKRLTQDIIQQSGCSCCRSNKTDHNTYKGLNTIALKSEGTTIFFGNISSDNSSNQEEKHHIILNKEPCGDILGVMIHGCLTITNLVCSILTRLALHPELQMKIFTEIKEVQQRTGKQESYGVQKMHFLLATVYESARLLPPSPFLQRCSLKHDLHLKSGVTVPAGALLVVPLQLVQMDNSVWGDDACIFNPDRFVSNSIDQEGMPDENGISEPDKKEACLSFGSGTRACIGQKFAILGISTLLASLLQIYEIRLAPGTENDVKLTLNDSVQRVPSPKIFFLRRSNGQK